MLLQLLLQGAARCAPWALPKVLSCCCPAAVLLAGVDWLPSFIRPHRHCCTNPVGTAASCPRVRQEAALAALSLLCFADHTPQQTVHRMLQAPYVYLMFNTHPGAGMRSWQSRSPAQVWTPCAWVYEYVHAHLVTIDIWCLALTPVLHLCLLAAWPWVANSVSSLADSTHHDESSFSRHAAAGLS